MKDFGISDNSSRLIKEALQKYPEVEEVVIFGSRARGSFKRGSDIDLAIKGKECNEQLAMNISTWLNEEMPLPYFVDIIYYNEFMHQQLKEHIDRFGKTFFKSMQSYIPNEPSGTET